MKRILKYLLICIFCCNISLAAEDIDSQITVLKKLYDDGLITQEEYSKAKSLLLEKYELKN